MQPDKAGFFKSTQQLAEEYIRERLLLLKLETAEKSARLASLVFASIIIGIFATIVILLLTVLGCYYLRQITQSWYLGIGLVTAFYVLIVVVLIIFRKSLLCNYITNFVIRIFFEKHDDVEA